MRVLQIYNQQRSLRGGEERVVLDTVDLLRANGVEVELHMVSSRGIEESLVAKIKAAGSGFYSFSSYRAIQQVIARFKPDVAHVHNVYPLLSPSVLVACRDSGVPVVFSVHSQILTCPTWYHFFDGAVCERCVGGKEYHCVLQNCRGNLVESGAYAVRSAYARKRDLFRKNTTLFLTMSRFMKDRLTATGILPERISLVPNMVRPPIASPDARSSSYVGFAGRLSSEKGVTVLLEAARKLPSIPFRVAGEGPLMSSLVSAAPSNVTFDGLLGPEQLSTFYNGARLVAVPSTSFEVGPLVALEALAHGVPVIGSRIGALPEAVIDGVTGSLFDTGNAEQLAQSISDLWGQSATCEAMGVAGQRLIQEQHSPEQFFSRTLKAYQKASDLHRQYGGVLDES